MIYCIIGICDKSFSEDKITDRYYRIYNSTSTPKIYKQILKRIMDKRVQMEELRANALKNSAQKRSLNISNIDRTTNVSSLVPLSADPSFKLGEVYCFPNPSKNTNPVFHIETGIADKIQIRIYDISGLLVHETTITNPPQVIDDGQGPQYAYEYLWDVKNTGSGVYIFNISAKKDDKTLKTAGRCAVIK